MILRQILLGCCVTLGAQLAMALGLGPIQGNVWLGQGLDVRIPLQLDDKDSANLSCLEAEVWHGEIRKEASRVRITLEDSAASAARATLRVQSSHVVDEPVVSIHVAVGCTGKVSRRYVVLPELQAPANLPQATDSSVGKAALVTSAASAASATPLSAASNTSLNKPSNSPRPTSAIRNESGSLAQASQAAPQTIAARPNPEGSRLRLDATDTLTERISVLEAQLKSLSPSNDAEVRIQALQTELKALREQFAQTSQQLLEMRSQLSAMQSEQWDPLWLYVLAGMCALSWVGLTVVARQGGWMQGQVSSSRPSPKKDVQPWWSAHPLAQQGFKDVAAPSVARSQPQPLKQALEEPLKDPHAYKVEAALLEDLPTPTMQSHLKAMGSEELFDIRQQAEFFMSLGQHDQAIEVLKQRIEMDQLTSPLVYLDLFHIYHMLGMRPDFAQLRNTFNRLFYGHVPEFAKYGHAGKDLESYELLTRQICERWNTPQAPDLLAQCIYRSDSRPATDFVDVPAFQDLILLYEISSAGQLVEF